MREFNSDSGENLTNHTLEELNMEYGNFRSFFNYGYGRHADNPISRKVRDFALEDITEVIASFETSPEGYGSTDVYGVFKCGDVYIYLNGGCDTTGWDCQSNGYTEWNEDLETLKACIPDSERKVLFPT